MAISKHDGMRSISPSLIGEDLNDRALQALREKKEQSDSPTCKRCTPSE
jgi:hypothetical protein